jgi:hypothetical protein
MAKLVVSALRAHGLLSIYGVCAKTNMRQTDVELAVVELLAVARVEQVSSLLAVFRLRTSAAGCRGRGGSRSKVPRNVQIARRVRRMRAPTHK